MNDARLILLGTAGGPTPKLRRSAPAQVLVVEGHSYVIDCGNGVAHQMVRAGVPLDSLTGVFITHHHSDHNADYGTLLQLAWASNLVRPVQTYGPPPLKAMTAAFLEMAGPDISTRVHDEGRPELAPLIHPHEVTTIGVVHEDDRVRVSATLVEHPPIRVALAYRFDTADRSIVVSGDTAPSAALVELARGADLLVHECIHLPAIADTLAKDPNASGLEQHLAASHTSVDLVGSIAEQAGVGTLVLSHLVPSDADIDDDTWRTMAARGFSGDVIVGADLMTL